MKLDILGTEYEIITRTGAEDEMLRHGNCGYCDPSVRRIVLEPFARDPTNMYQPEDVESERRAALRHEIVHAFAAECGLTYGSSWAQNESCVEWIARMFPKLLAAFQEADAIDASLVRSKTGKRRNESCGS